MITGTDTLIEEYLATMEEAGRYLPRSDIRQAIDILYECWRKGGTVYIIGNGGSASTATHFACDLAKATIVSGRRRFRAIALGDNVPLVSAWTNDNGFASIFAEQLEPWLGPDDVLVALSVHGGSGDGEAGPWSQNLPRAVALARQRGARVIGLSGFGGGHLAGASDTCIIVPIGREPLGTPLVESLHVAVHHLICVALKERIQGSEEREGRDDGDIPGQR
jgi:D-sedoheptulose 7-phosphate isomerase